MNKLSLEAIEEMYEDNPHLVVGDTEAIVDLSEILMDEPIIWMTKNEAVELIRDKSLGKNPPLILAPSFGMSETDLLELSAQVRCLRIAVVSNDDWELVMPCLTRLELAGLEVKNRVVVIELQDRAGDPRAARTDEATELVRLGDGILRTVELEHRINEESLALQAEPLASAQPTGWPPSSSGAANRTMVKQYLIEKIPSKLKKNIKRLPAPIKRLIFSIWARF